MKGFAENLWERWPWESCWERWREIPWRGSGVWRGGRGSTGIPHGRGNRGTPGKGGKVSQGCPQTGKCRRDPRKGLGRGQGCHRDPHTGKVQKRPRKGAEGRAELSAGTRSGSGRWRGRRASPSMGTVQESPQEGEACPDRLENEGDKTVTNRDKPLRPPQISVTPKGLKHPTPEGREKI